LYKIIQVNKKLSLCINDQYFWQIKLEFDYGILNKKNYQKWFDRYKLAHSSGYICIYDTIQATNLKLNCLKLECGKSSEGILYKYILDVKAINAFINSDGLYYLTDNLEFYHRGYTNVLIDCDVTYIVESFDKIYYIKKNDIYTYTGDKQRITFTGNVRLISVLSNEISYITFDDVCHHRLDGNNNWNEYTDVVKNISNVVLLQDCSVFLTTYGKIEGVNVNYDNDLSDIVDIFGGLMLLTSDHKIISFYYSGEYDYIDVFELCHDFIDVNDIVKAVDLGIKRMCLTKKGEVYLSEFGQFIKLDIKAKNIFDNSKYVIMII
jgi:hypothetical protein